MQQIFKGITKDIITKAKKVVDSGGVIAIPTDTIYGLAVGAFNKEAVEKLYEVKKRGRDKAIPVLIGDVNDLEKVAKDLNPKAKKLAEKFWPGALTLIVKKQSEIADAISLDDTVGVRIPDHDLIRGLLRATGPLATTSANVSGEAPALDIDDLLKSGTEGIDLIIDGGDVDGGVASTVVDCTDEEFRILRVGPITEEMLKS